MAKIILVIDDEAELLELIADTLLGHGYEILSAKDAYTGLNLALSMKPDLIVLDINMPAGGGLGAYHNLRHSTITSSTPIIFVSAYINMNKIPDDPLIDHMSKPFKMAELLSKIQMMLKEGDTKNNA